MTPPKENTEQNPLSCHGVLRRWTVTSSKVYTQPPHAALLSSELTNQHIPALGGNRKTPACRSCRAAEGRDKQTNASSERPRHSESNNAPADTHPRAAGQRCAVYRSVVESDWSFACLLTQQPAL